MKHVDFHHFKSFQRQDDPSFSHFKNVLNTMDVAVLPIAAFLLIEVSNRNVFRWDIKNNELIFSKQF